MDSELGVSGGGDDDGGGDGDEGDGGGDGNVGNGNGGGGSCSDVDDGGVGGPSFVPVDHMRKCRFSSFIHSSLTFLPTLQFLPGQ